MEKYIYTGDQNHLKAVLGSFLQQDEENELVIKGYAGTGKTTICIEELEPFNTRKEIVFTAPTNKAVKVMRDIIVHKHLMFGALTIHSLLGIRPGQESEVLEFEHTGKYKNIGDVFAIVVDEASQLNDGLLQVIAKYQSRFPRVKWIYMGDPQQLRPVKQEYRSRIFTDVHRRTVEMKEIVRQVAGSPTAKLSTYIRQNAEAGRWPVLKDFLPDEGFQGEVLVLSGKEWRRRLLDMVTHQQYEDRGDYCRAIAWRNVTVSGVNDMVRSAIYPNVRDPFVVGERVLTAGPIKHKSDDEFVAHTDDEFVVMEIVKREDPIYRIEVWDLLLEDSEGLLLNAFVPTLQGRRQLDNELSRYSTMAKKGQRHYWGTFWAMKERFDDIRPCHALTSHRAQGSTYDYAFVNAGDIGMNRNLEEALESLYVGSTRARIACYLRED